MARDASMWRYFDGTGIEQPAMGRIGFRVPDIDSFEQKVEKLKGLNPLIAPRPTDLNDEGGARLALHKRCPFGAFHMVDPDGNMIDVAQVH
jgi:catechol 2,3-dioxygenase-like lactoylglutathione lyase family enzyme